MFNFSLSNTLQTMLSFAALALAYVLTQSGCVVSAASATGLDCSHSMLSPMFVYSALAVIAFLKFIGIPKMQAGGILGNLFGMKAVVTEKETPGTVSKGDLR